MMRDGDQAFEVYNSFNPAVRGLEPDNYFVEPYVTPGNVDGPDSPNFGRGGWTWYTGSAAWYAVVILNYLLGIRPTREGLIIDPVIPKKWNGFKVKRLLRGSTYHITVENPKHVSSGVKKLTLDGKPVEGNLIKLPKAKGTYKIHVVLS